MTNGLPKDKADLLARIQSEWSALISIVENLKPEQANVPDAGGWSVKDNLAHLAEWEQFMIGCYLHGHPAHEAMRLDKSTYEKLDETGLNAVLYERNKGRTFGDILQGLKRSHVQVLEVLEKMAFADMMVQLDPNDPERRPVMVWIVGNTYEHYQEHRQTIEALVRSA